MTENVIPEVKTVPELREMSRTALTKYAETVGQSLESVLRVARGETWTRIRESTKEQERAIRDYAQQKGFTDLRQFRSEMRAEEWTYYDVLKLYYAGT